MKRRNLILSVLPILVISIIFSSHISIHAQPPGPPTFHYILGSATYGVNGPYADGALVTVTNLNTSETLTDIVGMSGQSNQSGWYLVDLLDFIQGYRHGDLIQVNITGTEDFSDWQGSNTTTVDNATLIQIVHVPLAGHPPLKPILINPPPGAMNIDVNPILKVHVVDPDGETMAVSFYDASNNTLIGTVSHVLNDSNVQIIWFGLKYNTTYNWYAVANDSLLETVSDIWSFKTRVAPLNPLPKVSFSWTPLSPTTMDTIHFLDFSTDDGTVISWKWEFGDGDISYLKNPAHKYNSNGPYQVNLTVMDNRGAFNSLSKTLLIKNIPPLANFTYSSDGTAVTFMDISHDMDGTIVDWYWEFGDGTTSIQQNPGHRYSGHGLYFVYLYVVDNDGDQGQLTQEIIIPPEDRALNVTITYPTSDEILNGTQILRGNAYANTPVIRVDIKIDTGLWHEAAGTTNWTYLWDTEEVENGNHILYARSYDGEFYSPLASVVIEVHNNHPPIATITKPSEDQTIKGKTSIQGWAADQDGNTTIQKIELRVDAGNWTPVLGTTVWLYELNTSELTNGYHTLEARAYDGIIYGERYSIVVKVENRDELFGFKKVFVFGGLALILAFVVVLLVIIAVLILDKTGHRATQKTKTSQKQRISKD